MTVENLRSSTIHVLTEIIQAAAASREILDSGPALDDIVTARHFIQGIIDNADAHIQEMCKMNPDCSIADIQIAQKSLQKIIKASEIAIFELSKKERRYK